MAPSEQHDDERPTPGGPQNPSGPGGADAPTPPGGPLRQDAPAGGTTPGGPGTPAQPGTPHQVDDPATSTRPDEPATEPHVDPGNQPAPRHRREDPPLLEKAQELNAESSEGEPSDASGSE